MGWLDTLGGGKERPPISSLKQRKLRRALALSAISLIAVSSTGIGVTSIVSPHAMAAAAAALRDQASVLTRRSPGARGQALMLTKHKPAALAAAEHAGGPKPKPPPVFAETETAGETPPPGAVVAPVPLAALGSPAESPGPAILAEAAPLGLAPPGEVGFGGLPGLGSPGGGGPIFVSSSPGGGGGGGPIAITPSPTPEPSVWAMLLIGFFGVGGVLRVRRGRDLADGARS